jgi:hypothetical protein
VVLVRADAIPRLRAAPLTAATSPVARLYRSAPAGHQAVPAPHGRGHQRMCVYRPTTFDVTDHGSITAEDMSEQRQRFELVCSRLIASFYFVKHPLTRVRLVTNNVRLRETAARVYAV